MRRTIRRTLAAAVLLGAAALPALAQGTPAELVTRGDAAYDTRHVSDALRDFDAAIAQDPHDYAALWRASRAEADLAEFEPNTALRDSLYRAAEAHGRAAVAANPTDAEGHFVLGRALGRVAMTLGVRDRVKYGTAVHDQAVACLKANSDHPGCLHILGVWNAEIMRLNGFQRMMARNFLGGATMGEASWDNALKYMIAAVKQDPRRITHRLDLARVYRDMGQRDNARAEYRLAADGAVSDYNDPHYKAQAAAELSRL